MDTTFVPPTIHMALRPNACILLMDFPSMSSLELVSSLSHSPTKAARKQTLLGLLDQTRARASYHFLRRNLLEPPCDQPTHDMRQAVVAEVSASGDLYTCGIGGVEERSGPGSSRVPAGAAAQCNRASAQSQVQRR